VEKCGRAEEGTKDNIMLGRRDMLYVLITRARKHKDHDQKNITFFQSSVSMYESVNCLEHNCFEKFVDIVCIYLLSAN
jgi:hypothetical protein